MNEIKNPLAALIQEKQFIGWTCRMDYEQAVVLTVCTDLQADALTSVLRERWPRLAHEDQDVARDRLPLLSVILSHLITEETYFSFTGIHPTSPAGAGDRVVPPAQAEGTR